MKFLDWDLDKWNSKQGSWIPYDKLEHFLLGFIGLLVTMIIILYTSDRDGISIHNFYAIFIWVMVGFLWEVKDGLFSYDGIHIQGFSWKDFIADCFGFIAAIVVYFLWARF